MTPASDSGEGDAERVRAIRDMAARQVLGTQRPEDRPLRGNVEGVLDALREAVKAYPDQRVCQIIVNATNRNDPFYVEDSELDRMLRDYAVQAGRDR